MAETNEGGAPPDSKALEAKINELTESITKLEGNNQNLVSALSQKYGPPTTGAGSLRIQQRRPDFSLIPTNPADRVAPTPTGELSAVVQWQTPTNLI
jgi:hypothetical protein